MLSHSRANLNLMILLGEWPAWIFKGSRRKHLAKIGLRKDAVGVEERGIVMGGLGYGIWGGPAATNSRK